MPLIPEVGRKNIKVILIIGTVTGILWLGVGLHLFPVWWMFTTSVKYGFEIFKFPPTLWPERITFSAYQLFFRLAQGAQSRAGINYPVYVYFKNSFIMTAGIMAIQVPVTALIAYALSKLYSPLWSRLIFLLCIGTMLVPGTISLIPRYLIIRHFPFPTGQIPNIPFTEIPFPHHNFINSYWAVILPAMFSPFNMLLFKGFFDGIPDELINAARLDGSSEIGIFRRIILPLSRPVFAVVAYFTFSISWNNFMWPLIVIQKNKLMPVSVMLYKFQLALTTVAALGLGQDEDSRRLLEAGMGYNGLMAIAIIESIPVFVMFLIFREQLMKGIKLRGFK